jgi:hypothetical protein
LFRTFEFFSIVEDHDEQNVDSLFGLGLQPPGRDEHEGYMNILQWMQQLGYIHHKVASIYISNYDGTESDVIKA